MQWTQLMVALFLITTILTYHRYTSKIYGIWKVSEFMCVLWHCIISISKWESDHLCSWRIWIQKTSWIFKVFISTLTVLSKIVSNHHKLTNKGFWGWMCGTVVKPELGTCLRHTAVVDLNPTSSTSSFNSCECILRDNRPNALDSAITWEIQMESQAPCFTHHSHDCGRQAAGEWPAAEISQSLSLCVCMSIWLLGRESQEKVNIKNGNIIF